MVRGCLKEGRAFNIKSPADHEDSLIFDDEGNKIFGIKSFICPTNAHNYYKIVKQLKSFKIIVVGPTCFGLHKSSSGSSQPVLR